MGPNLGHACLVATVAVTLGTVTQAGAAGCRSDVIAGRFVEAHRLCGSGEIDSASAVVPSASTGAHRPSSVSVEVPDRRSVSIAMPSYRRRHVAVQEVRMRARARGMAVGAAPPVLVTAVARRYRINPRLLASMMHTESRGNPRAISNKGALGLMQVMPGTARSLGIADPRAMLANPVLAMSAGAVYLKKLQAQFGNNVPLVVAAYNAGPGAVVRAGHRVPRYRETQGYVRNVMGGLGAKRR